MIGWPEFRSETWFPERGGQSYAEQKAARVAPYKQDYSTKRAPAPPTRRIAMPGPLLVGLVVVILVVEVFVVVRIDIPALASAFAIVVLVVVFIVDRRDRPGVCSSNGARRAV